MVEGYLPTMNLAANLSYFSLVVIVVLVPLVLYKIHIATSRLVMEGDNSVDLMVCWAIWHSFRPTVFNCSFIILSKW